MAGGGLALTAILAHVALTGACCSDHAMIKNWRELALGSRRLAGYAPAAPPESGISRSNWGLRRWWIHVRVREKREAQLGLLQAVLSMAPQTAEQVAGHLNLAWELEGGDRHSSPRWSLASRDASSDWGGTASETASAH